MTSTYVAIVDHSLGNLFSVRQACLAAGMEAEITSSPRRVLDAAALILPGVGAFEDAMRELRREQLLKPIQTFAASGRPLLGVCLGFQLLMSESQEFGVHEGIGLLEGTVERFDRLPSFGTDGGRSKIPQIGWNSINPAGDISRWKGTLLHNAKPEDHMYFLHSYVVRPAHPEIELARTTYAGVDYCSAVQMGNITAFQFHPERSGRAGLKIYSSLRESLGLEKR